MWGSAVRVCPGLHRCSGGLAQLARAPALQAGGRGFEPHILHESGTREGNPSLGPRGSLTGWKESRHKSKTSEKHEMPFAARRRQLTRARSELGRTEDALAPGGDEGRGRPRKSAGRRERPLIRRCPNGATRRAEARHPLRGEANPTNRNIPVVGGKENKSDPPSSGERKGDSPNRPRQGADGVVGQPSWKKST